MKNRHKLAAMIIPMFILFGTPGISAAQTADGSTPSEESICNSEVGAAFGLCNAYCEAMDCDSSDPQASDQACSKVSMKFLQTTGRDRLPCEQVACPCDFSAMALLDLGITATDHFCVVNDDFPVAELIEIISFTTNSSFVNTNRFFGPDTRTCESNDTNNNRNTVFELTVDELQSCADDIVAGVIALGIAPACRPPPDFLPNN